MTKDNCHTIMPLVNKKANLVYKHLKYNYLEKINVLFGFNRANEMTIALPSEPVSGSVTPFEYYKQTAEKIDNG